MPNPLFSRYSQGENRVTASTLAVFERISFALLERILQTLCQEPNLSLLVIKNQYKPKNADSVPDGVIQASFTYLLETKVVQNSVNLKQIKEHLIVLDNMPEVAQKKLIVLTPDYEEPSLIKGLRPDVLVWASFNALYDAISEILTMDENWLASSFSLVSEQERFLLKELVQMFLAEGLINNGSSDSVLIVPARGAIFDYKAYSAYLCQPNRSFQRVEYLGFYHGGAIDRNIAKILVPPIESVELTEQGIQDLIDTNKLNEEASPSGGSHLISEEVFTMLKNLVGKLEPPLLGDTRKVFFLSAPGDEGTIQLKQDIQNDSKSAAGKPVAFTMGQRYVPLKSLKENPLTTTELLNM
jgi:hypothetical protein